MDSFEEEEVREEEEKESQMAQMTTPKQGRDGFMCVYLRGKLVAQFFICFG